MVVAVVRAGDGSARLAPAAMPRLRTSLSSSATISFIFGKMTLIFGQVRIVFGKITRAWKITKSTKRPGRENRV